MVAAPRALGSCPCLPPSWLCRSPATTLAKPKVLVSAASWHRAGRPAAAYISVFARCGPAGAPVRA